MGHLGGVGAGTVTVTTLNSERVIGTFSSWHRHRPRQAVVLGDANRHEWQLQHKVLSSD
jgi:hypothetical protein